jgi:DNA-binding NarL/FixJ family response regulator
MLIISGSDHQSFHNYLELMFEGRTDYELQFAPYKEILSLAIANQDALIILDVHSNGKLGECNGFELLKSLRSNKINIPVLMLSWFTRKHIVRHTQHNTSNNQWLFIRYQNCYKFCQLPLTYEDLSNSIKTLKPFDHE